MPEKVNKPKQPQTRHPYGKYEKRKQLFNKRLYGGMHATSEEVDIGGCDISVYDELL